MTARMTTIAVIATAREVSERSDQGRRAIEAGRVVAALGCNLLTGGGPGAMELAARAFCRVPKRAGRSIGIIPGVVTGLGKSELGKIGRLTLKRKEGYARKWIEIPIFTHLNGKDEARNDDPKGPTSRNILNVATADIVVVLEGSKGTQAELELALALRKPVVAFLGPDGTVGPYTCAKLKKLAPCVDKKAGLVVELKAKLARLAK
jgi:hypothetical protein